MQIDKFKQEFKGLNGVYATDRMVLFRDPLELYDLRTGETVATFGSLEEALNFEIDGKTLEQRVAAWTEITFTLSGGRGSSGGGYEQKWPSAGGGGGADHTTPDLPARVNTLLGANRSYEDALKAFRDLHANADSEHAVTVDAQGFVTQYVHGNDTSVSISGIGGTRPSRAAGWQGDMVVHNHPKMGWPTFSKEDMISTANDYSRGIVAVSSREGRSEATAKYAGTYTFTKGHNFNATGFTKAINNATIKGNDYNDAVSKWLKANQKKYGYTYTFKKA